MLQPSKKIRIIVFCLMLVCILAAAVFAKGWWGECVHQKHEYSAIPEFGPVSTVILPDHLILNNFHGPEIIKDVIAAGADVALVSLKQNRSVDDDKLWLKSYDVGDFEAGKIKFLELEYENPWLRDFGPLMALDERKKILFLDFMYEDKSRIDDVFPQKMGALMGIAVRVVPLPSEGGNFLTDGTSCFMSSPTSGAFGKDFGALRKISVDEAKERIGAYFKDFAGCKSIVYFENVPHPHIDMWAKIVNDKTVFVSRLDPKALDLARDKDGGLPIDFVEIQNSLDAAALEFSKHLKVVRIPMPLPFRGSFRNFTNSLLVNGVAIVPSYARFGWNYDDYPDKALENYYEREVKSLYEEYGLKVKFVNADALIYNGGAFRCVSLQMPRINQ